MRRDLGTGPWIAAGHSPVPPRMRSLVAEVLGVDEDQLTTETSLCDDLAADSLDLAELVLALEREFAVSLPETIFDGARTYGELVETITDLMLGPDDPVARARTDLVVKASIVSPAGLTALLYGGVFTAYAAEELFASAVRSGPGTYLELTVPRSATDATLAALRRRFAELVQRGIEVDVRREGPAGHRSVPPVPRNRPRTRRRFPNDVPGWSAWSGPTGWLGRRRFEWG